MLFCERGETTLCRWFLRCNPKNERYVITLQTHSTSNICLFYSLLAHGEASSDDAVFHGRLICVKLGSTSDDTIYFADGEAMARRLEQYLFQFDSLILFILKQDCFHLPFVVIFLRYLINTQNKLLIRNTTYHLLVHNTIKPNMHHVHPWIFVQSLGNHH